jgi:hypothetical protein
MDWKLANGLFSVKKMKGSDGGRKDASCWVGDESWHFQRILFVTATESFWIGNYIKYLTQPRVEDRTAGARRSTDSNFAAWLAPTETETQHSLESHAQCPHRLFTLH